MSVIRVSDGEEYALEFVGGLPAVYTCSHCHRFLGEPYQNSECGDRFCSDCRRLIANGAKKCPQCSARMTADTTFVDAAVRREMGALEVCCPFKRCGDTLPYRNLKDHMEACPKKATGAGESAGDGSSAAMRAVERRLEGLERTVRDLQLKFDGFNTQASSLALWNNTTSPGDNGAARQMGEMARRLQTLEEIAQRASLLRGSISFDANAFETPMPGLTRSLKDLFATADRREPTSHAALLTWKIDNFRQKKKEAVDDVDAAVFSPPFYSHRFGYKMRAHVYLNGDGIGRGEYISLFLVLMKGEYDGILEFPFALRVKFTLVDQEGHSRDLSNSFSPNPRLSNYQRPTSAFNLGAGFLKFVRQSVVETPTYLKDDCIYLRIAVGNATSGKPTKSN